ncbi:DUF6278 family protein [Streptomyces sp. H27-C3]|uniref:DUF6278 family protein n=1 Tax=Streptomyces sp. H27-C3 TaxID=3046305 RepID=UPI0024BB2155|nr:DUF6278 family protein [Streptomyces sp. H27-C3]MDJ0462840.1 DUF6278 family protein [Streptomyces sp. H27-C3]
MKNIPFLDNWRKRHATERGTAVFAIDADADQEGIAELFSECELLRVRVAQAGLELDDSPASLEALDQLPPRWRDDPEELPWLGNDAGLYLGTVIVRTVPGALWQLWPSGQPVVRLASGREINVVEAGLDWAVSGAPELSQVYGEAAEA